jgi:hypothetical protein
MVVEYQNHDAGKPLGGSKRASGNHEQQAGDDRYTRRHRDDGQQEQDDGEGSLAQADHQPVQSEMVLWRLVTQRCSMTEAGIRPPAPGSGVGFNRLAPALGFYWPFLGPFGVMSAG